MIKYLTAVFFSILFFNNCTNENKKSINKYYESGELKESYFLINGSIDGVLLHYFKSGGLKVSINWDRGKQHGLFTEYYESGNIQSKINFINNMQSGIAIYYYDTYKNITQKECRYINDSLNGSYREYSPSGDKQYSSLYYQNSLVLTAEFDKRGMVKDGAFCIDIILSDSISQHENEKLKIKLYNKDIFSEAILLEGDFLESNNEFVTNNATLFKKDKIEVELNTTNKGLNFWSGSVKCIHKLDTNKYMAFPIYFSYIVK